jgi:hypothetical protein
MSQIDEIDLYLPQYLSSDAKDTLKNELQQFTVDGITKKSIYTIKLNEINYLLQGDGINDVKYLCFPDTNIKSIPVILLSNTCDMSLENERMNPCRIVYAPLIRFDKYKKLLNSKYDETRVNNHLHDIKSQLVTQVLYLPKGMNLDYDAIAFFDRVISIPLTVDINSSMCKNKLFTLSNFGFYLFLLKLSIHYTRIQEKIDRD